MGELLWLEPTGGGRLPPTSIFFSSGRFVISSFVIGTHDPRARPDAYLRMVEALEQRARQVAVGHIRVKHSHLSAEYLGTTHPPYSLPLPPSNLSSVVSFSDIFAEQKLLYGDIPEVDKIKLVFQAVHGGGHFISDDRGAIDGILDEWVSVRGISAEPLAERISPDGDIYRINLRPARELGINPTKLARAVRESAGMVRGSIEERKQRLLSQVRTVGVDPHEIPSSPVHHSPDYTRRFRPAYRLIHAAKIAGLIEQSD